MARKFCCIAALAAASAILLSGTRPAATQADRVRAILLTDHLDILYADPRDLNFSYGPKGDELADLTAGASAAATFQVTYNGFSAQAQAAFQAAVNIWANTISSPVPIRIRANWTSLGSGILGSAGSTVGCMPTGGVPNTWYPAALADKIQGSQFCAALVAETHEIVANFNSDFTAWDFGTSGTPVPGQWNFMTVVLHEIGHGLGFFGRLTSSAGQGTLGSNFPYPYDRFAVTGSGVSLLDTTVFPRPSAALHNQLVSNNTFFNGSNATSRNGGVNPKLETHDMTATFGIASDNGFRSGSSYSHADDVLYTATANGLMTWALGSNEAYTDVGPIVKGIFLDQGWSLNETTPPGAPTLVSPTGTINTATPDFVWNVATGADDSLVTTYDLAVTSLATGTSVVNANYTAASICNATTCTKSSPVALAEGNYQWWVRAHNAAGAGAWSAGATFTVDLVSTPAGTTIVAPAGTGTSLTPTYTWNVAAGATYYYLWVQPAAGGSAVIATWYQSGAVCGATTCSATPAVTLSPMTGYSAWVRTWNADGYGPWSPVQNFTTGAPAAITLIAPSGTVTTPAPTYSWNESASVAANASTATSYYLWVQRTGASPSIQTTYQASAVCASGVCSVTPRTELINGTYSWWIQAVYPWGNGPWSSPGSFTVNASIPAAASGTWPLAGAQGAQMPTYEWDPVAGATWYRLWMSPVGGGALIDLWFFGADICQAVCAVTPNVGLTPGTSYIWYVRTWSSRGDGPWSPGITFTIATTPPGAATLVSPTGAGAPATPNYTWNRVASASFYNVWVNPVGGGAAVNLWYRAEQICNATTCTAMPAVNLPASQNYVWYVRTYNDAGYGPWSSAMAFSR